MVVVAGAVPDGATVQVPRDGENGGVLLLNMGRDTGTGVVFMTRQKWPALVAR